MPIESWLSALAQTDHSAVDGDLDVMASKDYPFLGGQSVSNQIERLSGHLGGQNSLVRRQVIGYSLYIRQVDAILERGARSVCCSACPTPPAGCCNREHFVIMNMADLMSSRNSPTALHMAHMIGLLQKLESAHNLGSTRSIRPGYCSLLAHDGCTLRLFKSPRCAHFLCEDLEKALRKETEGRAQPFLAAMKHAEGCTISAPSDYANPDVIVQALLLYGRPAQAASA